MTTAATIEPTAGRRAATRATPDAILCDGGAMAPVALDASLRQLHGYWRTLSPRGLPPQRSALDPFEIRELLPRILLLQVVEDGEDFEYRIAGQEVENATGRSLRGLRLTDVAGRRGRDRVLDDYRRVALEGRPHFRRDRLEGGVRPMGFQRLILPLHTGKAVTHIVGAMVFDGTC
ncbi:MAG TPA: PAS domain-containing protein [Azospirillaceae bacterium]|nr:PAS domain-containing protein [Azospirillaceae bacterium]